MPGNKITDHQVRKYKEMRKRATQEIAAAKTVLSATRPSNPFLALVPSGNSTLFTIGH
jgi:hypothetical protein